ncbi:MAG: FixH family protein [Sulfuricurvum sp.]
MKKVLSMLVLASSFAFANGFMHMGMSDDLHVMLSSPKVLSEGDNTIKVDLNRDSKSGDAVDAKDVRIKFFMPEMPGMPYMESKDVCKKSGTAYECNINFSMNGTWQFLLLVKDDADDEYKYKGSVNLGQASHHHHH